jgi:hypothetical protein
MLFKHALQLSKQLYCFIFLLATLLNHSSATTLEQETVTRVNQLRTVRVDQGSKSFDAYNKQMDDAWKFFKSNKTLVLPILRSQLKDELRRAQPNDLVLLDIGFFLHLNDGDEGKALGLDALFSLNPNDPVIVANGKQLFEFAHAAAREHDPRVLAFTDRAYLSSNRQVFIPQHALKLDSTLLCVFLYGAYGPESERHLRAKLSDRSTVKRVLETLVWLGSPASLPEVRDAFAASPDYETFARLTSYMMQSAGPEGRSFMLALSTRGLDQQSQQYYSKVQTAIRSMSFESIKASFARFPGDKVLPNAEILTRLSAMIENYGKDNRTSPLAILESTLSSELLTAELAKVRSRSLHRLSDEALSDVQVSNALMNGLRYRGK